MPVRVPLLLLALLVGCGSRSESYPPRPPAPATAAPPVSPDTVAVSDGGAVALGEPRKSRLLAEDSLWARALRLHYDAIVVDGHSDTPTLMLDEGYQLGERHRPRSGSAHVDLPRMVEGGLDAPFFSIFVSQHYGEGTAATDRALAMIRELKRQVAALDGIEMASTYADVVRLTRAGKKAALMGLEGGHATQASPEVLRRLREEGVRYVTLTHVNNNSFADASQSAPRWGGLNDKGRALVAEMNRLGLIVDVSHVSDSTLFDAVRASRAPVMASHSSARALVNNVRNLSDDQLRAIAAGGGVVMINFFDPVINEGLTDEVMAAAYERLQREHGGNLRMIWRAVSSERAARGLPRGTAGAIVDHIEHVIRVAGPEHVGLGSDFDGVFSLPEGMEDVTRLPFITYELLRRGHSEAVVRGVLGGNALRVLREAERVAAELQAEG